VNVILGFVLLGVTVSTDKLETIAEDSIQSEEGKSLSTPQMFIIIWKRELRRWKTIIIYKNYRPKNVSKLLEVQNSTSKNLCYLSHLSSIVVDHDKWRPKANPESHLLRCNSWDESHNVNRNTTKGTKPFYMKYSLHGPLWSAERNGFVMSTEFRDQLQKLTPCLS